MNLAGPADAHQAAAEAAAEAAAAFQLLLLLYGAAVPHCLLFCVACTKMHAVTRQAAGYLKKIGIQTLGAIYSVSEFAKVPGTYVH